MESLLLAVALIAIIIWWLSNRRRKPGNRRLNMPSQQSLVPRHLQNELIRIAGNSCVAERLVDSLRDKYPGKPEKWYWEKAIFDLERDRHY